MSKNGRICINRVDYIKRSDAGAKYAGMSLVRSIILKDDYATQVGHFDTDSESLLTYSTARGKIAAIDLRTMKTVLEFQSPLNYGQVTAFSTDGQRNWAISGTNRGVVSIWDLRFNQCIKTWRHPSKSRINQIDMYPLPVTGAPTASRLIRMGIENSSAEISTWDAEAGKCYLVDCVMNDLINVDEELNQRYGSGLHSIEPPVLGTLSEFPANFTNSSKLLSRRYFAVDPSNRMMVSAGADRKIRYSPIDSQESGMLVSGRDENFNAKISSFTFQDMHLTIEHTPQAVVAPYGAPSRGSTFASLPRKAVPAIFRSRQTRNPNVESVQYPDYTTRHRTEISAISVCKLPENMIITGAHDGIVKLWQ